MFVLYFSLLNPRCSDSLSQSFSWSHHLTRMPCFVFSRMDKHGQSIEMEPENERVILPLRYAEF